MARSGRRPIVLVDVDHTLSDAAWRDHLLPTHNPESTWEEYYADQEKDAPIKVVCDLVRAMFCDGYTIIVLTGRDEAYREATKRWLSRHDIPLGAMIMRPTGDLRSSPEMKLDLVQKYLNGCIEDVALIVEDRPDCVEALRALGRPILQVHYEGKGTICRD